LGIGADFDLNGDIFDIEMWRFEQWEEAGHPDFY
jgi:hypothetical protein